MFRAGAINEAANDITVYCAIIEYRNSLLLLLLNIIALYSFMALTPLKYGLARFTVLSSFLFALHSLNIALVANSRRSSSSQRLYSQLVTKFLSLLIRFSRLSFKLATFMAVLTLVSNFNIFIVLWWNFVLFYFSVLLTRTLR